MKIQSENIDTVALAGRLADVRCGGFVTFEGWVRDLNEGRAVLQLEYEVYAPIAESEGEVILTEARERFAIVDAWCEHREGLLQLGDCAVWVGVTAAHRDAAFDACRYIIDNVKSRLPIWKKEFYTDGDSGWVNCEACASHSHVHPSEAAAD